MKKLLLFIVSLLSSVSAFADTPWETYLTEPSSENAKHVMEISYSTDDNDEWSGLGLLETQVASGDVEALRLALRLAETADGGLLHDLEVIASRSIRSHPEQFSGVATTDGFPEQLVNNCLVVVGEEYIDRPRARRYELSARFAALRDLGSKGESHRLDAMLARLQAEIDSLNWARSSDREWL